MKHIKKKIGWLDIASFNCSKCDKTSQNLQGVHTNVSKRLANYQVDK